MSIVPASRALREVANDLQPRFEIEIKRAGSMVAEGVSGLPMVGEGAEELDQEQSLEGVNAVVESFDQMGPITR